MSADYQFYFKTVDLNGNSMVRGISVTMEDTNPNLSDPEIPNQPISIELVEHPLYRHLWEYVQANSPKN